ncbi:hypothetical protein BH20PSE1_BH20PSE1_02350 [soil metagenome]
MFDAELAEQLDEVRIGPVVEYDEAGIHREPALTHDDVVRMRMTADVARRLEHGNVVFALQVVGNNVAGDAAADDGYFHACFFSSMRRLLRMCAGTVRRSQIRPVAASRRRT